MSIERPDPLPNNSDLFGIAAKFHRVGALDDDSIGVKYILSKCKQSIKAASLKKDTRPEWDELHGHVQSFEQAVSSGDESLQLDALIRMTFVAGRLSSLPDGYEEVIRLKYEADRLRGQPNEYPVNEFLKFCSWKISAERWAEDQDHSIGIGKMAAFVMEKLMNITTENSPLPIPDHFDAGDCYDGIPTRPRTIEDWIRDIAPPWARKKGRPRKA